ncbi:hypothetical protein J3R82DRAFT_3294 [Butyriboletus roseoflavus]|nr:hypothetical protein J3R82DRAFT_3294 [Butyriboletus roseoflavus]
MHALKTTLVMMAGLAALFTLGAAQSVPFYTPTANGGSMLVDAQDGYGEPLNVIISGESSAAVLTDDGIVNYARAIGLYVLSFFFACLDVGQHLKRKLSCSSTECAGIHIGAAFTANLGDGNGPVAQTIELRQDYGDPIAGTCWESLVGGNHFRWVHVFGWWCDVILIC